MSDFITPTVGRVVWFYPVANSAEGGFALHPDRSSPYAALIAHVWNDRMVNLSVIDADGNSHSRTSVTLLQPGDHKLLAGYYCEWMSFQKGQARAQESMYAAVQAAEAVASIADSACKGLSDAAIVRSSGDKALSPATAAQAINKGWRKGVDALDAINSGPSRREKLEVELVIGASRALAEDPSAATALAEGVKKFLDVLHPVNVPNLIDLPPLAAGSTIDVVVSEPGDAGRLTTYKLEPKAGVATAITCDTSAAMPPAADAHVRNVLYGAIRNAMEELAALHPGFNDHVNRAWNHLHRAFWSEAPAPASAPGLRDELPAAEPGIVLSPTKQQDAVEQLIQANGKTAPRVTPSDLADNIASEHYFTAAQGVAGEASLRHGMVVSGDVRPPEALNLLTFCVLVLRNGFTVSGESACASPENFDAEIGQRIARENAVQKIWPLMGYALKQRLHDAA